MLQKSTTRVICNRRLSWSFFCLLFFSFAYFQHSAPGWNVNSRFALSLALGETGSPAVERYVSRPGLETQDLASYNGHLYSDKSIGTSLLAVPAVRAVKAMESIADTTFSTAARRWIVTALSVGVAGALSGVLLMKWLSLIWTHSRHNHDSGRSEDILPILPVALLSAGVMLGTMLFLYGTLLMSYLPATACLLGCLVCIERAQVQPSKILWVVLAGMLGGLAVLCEYTYAAAVGLAGIYLLVGLLSQSDRNETRPRFRQAAMSAGAYAIGGLLGIAPFLIYTISIFGRPTIPYEYHLMPEFREAMARGFMGAGIPKPEVLLLITLHPFRGIFVYSPLLLLGFVGLLLMLVRDSGRRAFAMLCLASSIFYLIFNSAYYMWWGGWSFSPRHLAPAVPFLAAGLLPWIWRGWGRILLAVTGIAGVAVHTMVNATEPQPPDGGWQEALLRPDLTSFDYPAVLLQDTWQRVSNSAFDNNLGSLLGLTGIASLVPLVVIWAAFLALASLRSGKSNAGNEAE